MAKHQAISQVYALEHLNLAETKLLFYQKSFPVSDVSTELSFG